MSDFNSQREIEIFLHENTTYDVDLLFRTKSYGQIINMCRNIKKALTNYPKEIISYLNSHPLVPCEYTDEDIFSMNYNELVELRKKLGIKNTRKKVVKSEQADKAYQSGQTSIRESSTNQLCFAIMKPSPLDGDRDMQILTDDEISQMYPGEDLTDEDLFARGIVRYSTRHNEILYSEEDRRYELINKILRRKISIGGIALTEEYLHHLDEMELTLLSDIAENFTKENKEKGLKK